MKRGQISQISFVCAVLVLFASLSLSVMGCHKEQPSNLNVIERHKTLSTLATGYAAYKAAKVTGENREAVGGEKNLFQKHPVLSGLAAAALAHHEINKSIEKKAAAEQGN